MSIRLWLSGFLVALGLMVEDEILTLAIYCQRCGYAIPLLGVWPLYDAEGLAWILILSGFALLIKRQKPERIEKKLLA